MKSFKALFPLCNYENMNVQYGKTEEKSIKKKISSAVLSKDNHWFINFACLLLVFCFVYSYIIEKQSLSKIKFLRGYAPKSLAFIRENQWIIKINLSKLVAKEGLLKVKVACDKWIRKRKIFYF